MGRSRTEQRASKEDSQPLFTFPLLTPRSGNPHKDICRPEILLADQIILFHNLLTRRNSDAILSFFTTTIAPHLSGPKAPCKGEAKRTSERWSTRDAALAAHLYHATGLDLLLRDTGVVSEDHGDGIICETRTGRRKKVVGLNENIRVYRYTQGTFFGPHYDDAVVDPKTRATSAWTLLIYIVEGDLRGGETSFQVGKGQTLAPPIEHGLGLIHRYVAFLPLGMCF